MRKGAQLTTTAEFGRERGWSSERALRTLKRLHARSPGPWLIRDGRYFRVNESLLRREHPEMYEAGSPADIEDRLDAVSEDVGELRMSSRTHGARLRVLERLVDDVVRELGEHIGYAPPR